MTSSVLIFFFFFFWLYCSVTVLHKTSCFRTATASHLSCAADTDMIEMVGEMCILFIFWKYSLCHTHELWSHSDVRETRETLFIKKAFQKTPDMPFPGSCSDGTSKQQQQQQIADQADLSNQTVFKSNSLGIFLILVLLSKVLIRSTY